jgi:hypothetical protein
MNKEEIIEFLKNNLEIRIYEKYVYVCNTKCNEISIKLLINDEEISSDSIIIAI